MRLALDAKAENQRGWSVLEAWLTARLTMADPKQYPSYESLMTPKTDAGADGIDHQLLARLRTLHEAQDRAKAGEDGNGAD